MSKHYSRHDVAIRIALAQQLAAAGMRGTLASTRGDESMTIVLADPTHGPEEGVLYLTGSSVTVTASEYTGDELSLIGNVAADLEARLIQGFEAVPGLAV